MYSIFVGNPYDECENGDTICVTTNGEVRKNGNAVMGRGSAEFARDTFKVDKLLGEYLTKYRNRAFYLGTYPYRGKQISLATFPTKYTWRDKSDIQLIKESALQMMKIADKFELRKVYIPIPGCGKGQLKWSEVKNVLSVLDSRFIVYSLNQNDFSR